MLTKKGNIFRGSNRLSGCCQFFPIFLSCALPLNENFFLQLKFCHYDCYESGLIITFIFQFITTLVIQNVNPKLLCFCFHGSIVIFFISLV